MIGASPYNSRARLAEVIAEKTLHVEDPKRLAKEIAAYLLHTDMTGELNSLLRDILQYRAERGHIEATAVSAYGLSEQVINDIERILRSEYPKAKSITIDKEYDPELVGGLKLKLANQQLDLSVQSKLNKFKRLTALERNKQ